MDEKGVVVVVRERIWDLAESISEMATMMFGEENAKTTDQIIAYLTGEDDSDAHEAE